MSKNVELGPRMVRRLPVSFETAVPGSVPARVLDAVRGHPEPVTILELSHELQLHANTVRHAVQTLTTAGLVVRAASRPDGRGRPAHAFIATAEAHLATAHGSGLTEHHGLTAALMAHLSEAADAPGQARSIGRRWGSRLLDDSPADEPAAIVDLLRRLGFSPTIDDAGIALHTCPLLEFARENPDVVCAIHAGLIDGAHEGRGRRAATAELRPFAEVGACRLRLTE